MAGLAAEAERLAAEAELFEGKAKAEAKRVAEAAARVAEAAAEAEAREKAATKLQNLSRQRKARAAVRTKRIERLDAEINAHGGAGVGMTFTLGEVRAPGQRRERVGLAPPVDDAAGLSGSPSLQQAEAGARLRAARLYERTLDEQISRVHAEDPPRFNFLHHQLARAAINLDPELPTLDRLEPPRRPPKPARLVGVRSEPKIAPRPGWRTTRATDTNGRHGAKAASLLGRFTGKAPLPRLKGGGSAWGGSSVGLSGRPLPSDK